MISSDLAEHLPPLLDVAARCGARLQQPFVLAVSQWVTISLQLVTTSDELRASVLRFNQEAKRWPYALQLVRATQYWVCDARSKAFGPSKFVGFARLDAAGYDAARAYQATGASFDGLVTRKAIEAALNQEFSEQTLLSQQLTEWGDALFEKGVLAGISPSKWKFVRVT